VQGEFAQVIEDLLFDKGHTEKLKEYFIQLHGNLQDENLRNEIAFMHHYENGRVLFNQARYRESISFFESALQVKPKHQETNRIFLATLANMIKNSTHQEAIKTLEGYATSHPLLLENNIFNEMLGTFYLAEMEMSFESNKAHEGEKYKTTFESFYNVHKEVTYNSHTLGRAYSAAAVYYFRKGQTPKAKTIIARGLEISPNNYELITRKRMIE
jgi:tetratricopeptide (TPR) repeat protein